VLFSADLIYVTGILLPYSSLEEGFMGSATISRVSTTPALPPPPLAFPYPVDSTAATELGEWDLDDATLRAQDGIADDADEPIDVEQFDLADDLWWGTKAMRLRHHALRLISLLRDVTMRHDKKT